MIVTVQPRQTVICTVLVVSILLSLCKANTIIPDKNEEKTHTGRKLQLFPQAGPSIVGTVARGVFNGAALWARSFGPAYRFGLQIDKKSTEVDSETGVAFVLETTTGRWTPIDPVYGKALLPPPRVEFDVNIQEYFVYIPSTAQRVYVDPSTGRPASIANIINPTTGFRTRGFNLNVGHLNVFDNDGANGVRIGNAFRYFNGPNGVNMSVVKKRRLNNAVDAKDLLNIVLELYNKLPKTGKPQSTEYTTLAAVVATPVNEPAVVISLATGSKCLPSHYWSPTRLNDSHAEILAKRAAVDYTLNEISHLNSTQKEKGILFGRSDKGVVRTQASIHLIITEPPCGDCMVIAQDSELLSIARTGAKPVVLKDGGLPIATDVEVAKQQEGVLRRKPGKGEATTSMSCSDKILRWSFLGFQGQKALSILLEPMYFDTVIVCAPNTSSESIIKSSMERALVHRSSSLAMRVNQPFKWHPPKICILSPLSDAFPFHESSTRMSRSNSCINWTRRAAVSDVLCNRTSVKSKARIEQNGYFEVTIGTLGVKYGSPIMTKNLTEVPLPFQSRVCQCALMKKMNCDESKGGESYREQWNSLKQEPSVFTNWITNHHLVD
eukprot:g5020.t1